MINDVIDEFVPYSGPGRKSRIHVPSFIIIHATRGPGLPENQYRGTINHVTVITLRRRIAGWNSMTDFVVGSEGTVGAIGDWDTTRSNWSAGKGTRAWWQQYGADEHGIAIELAQTNQLEPMTEACLDSAAALVYEIAMEYSIPLVHLPFITQMKNETVPKGLVGHDETANGRKWGKSDPGWSMGTWASFIKRVNETPNRVPGHRHHFEVDGLEGITGDNF